jgi:hypothetical protein
MHPHKPKTGLKILCDSPFTSQSIKSIIFIVSLRVAEPENLKTVPVPTFYLNTVPGPAPVPVPGHIHAYIYTYTYMCISL